MIQEPLVKPEQAIVVTRILEAIYKSAETGKVIEFLRRKEGIQMSKIKTAVSLYSLQTEYINKRMNFEEAMRFVKDTGAEGGWGFTWSND